MASKNLKEDGSLDVEKIDKLPLKEWLLAMGNLTENQAQEYLSKQPHRETHGPITPIKIDWDIMEIGVDATEFLENEIKKYGKTK